MKRRIVVLGCALGLLIFNNLHAENIKLDEVVVTATKTEVKKSDIPASITVITAGDIEEKHATSVSDLLRDIPGIDVSRQGGAGKMTSVFIRGAKSEHTLVLIDGMRVNSPTTGGFDFADITVNDIERIEIIRGPSSTLYGSDAIAGVIQIFTKKAKISSASASLEGGSFGTKKEAVSLDIKRNNYDMNLSASHLDTDGFSTFKAGSEKDGYQNTSVSARFGKTTGRGRIDLTGHMVTGKTDLDGCKFDSTFTPYDCDNPAYQQERRLVLAGLRYQSHPGSRWGQAISASITTEHLVNSDPDPNGINSTIDTGIRAADWQNIIQTSEGNRLTFGYEWQNKDGDNKGNFNKSLSNHAVYLQDQLGLGAPVQLLAGVRWDDSTIYESALTYRFGLTWLQMESLKWHAQYGTGFKGPSLNDLFWPGAGNTNLKPEKSNSLEAGVETNISDSFSLSVSYYHNDFKDLIQWAPIDPSDPYSLWNPQNVGHAVSSGVESEMHWAPLSFLQFTGNYIYDDTEDKANGGYLMRRPLNKYSADMKIGDSGRNIGIHFIHVGRRFDSQGNLNPISAYNRVDLTGAYRIAGYLEVFGRVENLLDTEYEEAKGYNTAGVSGYGGVKVTY
ncbi:MAG: TonB-dependent receptor [Nitrospirae bacterium]|nr:TonB-dependent receptor [Nitrospirota bacterium]